MKQAYNTPNLTFVRLPKRDIITDSPQTTISINYNAAALDDWRDIGAADRFRDWE